MKTLAVIVGRYQIHQLQPQQIEMIRSVIGDNSRTIIVLANSLMRGTIKNPLDFQARKAMILEQFPKLEVYYLNDTPKDNVKWSNNLDELINSKIWGDFIPKVTIYGGKTTVVDAYSGKYAIKEFEASTFVNIDELRKKIAAETKPTLEFRAGVMAAQIHRYPTAYQTVDVAPIDENNRVLMAKKPGETKWRFIGGFSDPTSMSLEMDARREVMEETGIEVDDIKYLGSMLVAGDSRYYHEVDKIKTAFFKAKYIYGRPTANDDICEVGWVPLNELNENTVADFHLGLLKMLLANL